MDNEFVMSTNGELTHWGVRGMRWGVRRYQNKDGSLTAAGKKRRAKLEKELKQLGGGKKGTNHSAPRDKSVSEMTDKQLQKYTARMQLEKQYYDAKRNLEGTTPKQVSAGKKFATKILNEAVVPSISNTAKSYLENYMKKTLGLSTEDTISALKKTYEKLDYEQKIDKIKNPDKYMSWDDKQKKYNYEKTKKADESAEAAKGVKKDPESPKQSDKSDSNSASKETNSSSNATGKQGKKQKSKTKVYEGTVEGVGNSSKQNTADNTRKNDTVIDAEWYDVDVSNVPAVVTNRGRSYISGLLEAPKERDD